MKFRMIAFLILLAVGIVRSGYPQVAVAYEMPPASIAELVDAPTVPKIELNPCKTWMIVLSAPRYVDMDIAAHPILGLGGLRVNPTTRTLEAENHGFFHSIQIKRLIGAPQTVEIDGLPTDLKMSHIRWHPEGQSFAFTNRTAKGLELWLADLITHSAKRLYSGQLNALTGDLIQWHPSGDYLLIQVPGRTEEQVPIAPRVPNGPVVQENLGVLSSSRTYQYLLSDPHDEALFDHYLESQLTKVYLDGRVEEVGEKSIFKKNKWSPDGRYLLVEKIKKPYSYLLPLTFFPTDVEIWDAEGGQVKVMVSTPLVENTPSGYDNANPFERNFHWRQDKPSELVWVKALDDGIGSSAAEFRDGIYTSEAPFDTQPKLRFRTQMRFNGVVWGNSSYAVVKESMRRTRSLKWTLVDPEAGLAIKIIDERSSEDAYTDPGQFVLDKGVIQFVGKKGSVVHTIGAGASPEGERPFLMRWDLLTGDKDTLFKSGSDHYEKPVAFDGDKHLFFTRESQDMPPNMYSVELGRRTKEIALTEISNPYPSLANVSKTFLSYPRKDGVTLTGTLYLPEGFEPNGTERLPVLVWAYPREFKSAAAAGQVKGSANRFTELHFRSPVYWVTRGYAVVDQADMPIVGEGEEEPNDSFIEQIEMNAVALIDHLVDMGVADRDRFGVGGHSYGAFMTANLLAHTDLFAAGIARSGAYNRTLTPFGFQAETRTYWQAKDVYDQMSPFNYADKIKLPILITHGMDDENSGTFPVQSERLYAAIKGHGGTTRLVMFPYEFHGFRARESIMHIFWEQDRWLENYVKNRKNVME